MKRGAIGDFVNNGGDLFGFNSRNYSTSAPAYGYLGGFGTFTFNTNIEYQNIVPTPAGEAIGITNALDVCCWHDEFVTFPAFLTELAKNANAPQRAAALGNLNVVVSGIQLAPVSSSGLINSQYSLTATITEGNAPAPAGRPVTFRKVTGPNTFQTIGLATTNAQGAATLSTYTSATPGIDTIEAFYLRPGFPTPQTSNRVTREWLSPNRPPSVSSGGPYTGDEGAAIALSGSATDPDNDQLTLQWSYTKGPDVDPTATCSFANANAASTTITCTDDGQYWVQLAASDGVNAMVVDNVVVTTVANVAPTATFAADPIALDEGTSFGLTLTNPQDPSGVDTMAGFGYAFDCGAGTGYGTFGPAIGATCPTDDNGSRAVKGTIRDKDLSATEYTDQVAINNAVPVVAITGAPATSPEGAAIALGSTVSAPSAADTAAGFTLAWSVSKNGLPYASGTAPSLGFTPDDDGTYVVTLTATDDDGGAGTDTKTIAVTNVAPTPAITGAPGTSPEGTAISLTGSATDPSSVDQATLTLTWAVTKNGSAYGSGGTGASFSFTPDDNGSYVVTLTATDKDGGSNTGIATITGTNVKPAVTISGPAVGSVYPVNTPITFTGSFTDAGTADTHTAQWAFDGNTIAGTVTESNGSGTVSNIHSFRTPGVYAVKLTVTDDDEGSGVTTTIGTDSAFIVVYDPSGGFVTGGGWITSPAKAYTVDPTMTGRASFGFVSKYQKGATVPTGETEFQFKAGNLNFHSTSYDWLVISGARAQYKGSGTINGQGDYGFLLTAVDGQANGGGGADKFRIKITDKATGAVIYDNQVGAADDAAPTTALGGGSIVIHTK